MDARPRTTITALDELEHVIAVIYFIGRVVGAVGLDETERQGAQAIIEWSAGRLRESRTQLAGGDQAGRAPN